MTEAHMHHGPKDGETIEVADEVELIRFPVLCGDGTFDMEYVDYRRVSATRFELVKKERGPAGER